MGKSLWRGVTAAAFLALYILAASPAARAQDTDAAWAAMAYLAAQSDLDFRKLASQRQD